MSSRLLKKFAGLRVTLYGVLDVQQIIDDLLKMLAEKYPNESLRDVEKKAKVGRGILQRIKVDPPKRLDVTVLDRVLRACGSSPAIYFGALASTEEIKKIKNGKEIVRLVGIAMKIPGKAEVLRKYLDALLADELRSEKSQQ